MQTVALLQALSLEMPAELCSLESSAYAVSPTGLDSVQFLLGAGPGEPLRSLAAVASGGESARILLALKAAPAAVTVWDQQANDCQTGESSSNLKLVLSEAHVSLAWQCVHKSCAVARLSN